MIFVLSLVWKEAIVQSKYLSETFWSPPQFIIIRVIIIIRVPRTTDTVEKQPTPPFLCGRH